MPGDELSQVKHEPVSDDDESSQYHADYTVFQNDQGSLEELAPAPSGPAATLVQEELLIPGEASLATLEPVARSNFLGSGLIERHVKFMRGKEVAGSTDFFPLTTVKEEPLSEGEQQQQSGDDLSDSNSPMEPVRRGSPKSWTQHDMDNALDALRNHHMTLTKASATFGIPSTTLWQRAHRLGIDTPKKENVARTWSPRDLSRALAALRAGHTSANKASKAYGIPSSTLYKIARREGIRLAAPFNAAPTAWRRADLARALAAVRAGAAVQRAAAQHGIPSGTLYGRCKREGIELSRSNPTPWSEDAMTEALHAVRVGQMSINQAAIHYNLPYSSLYGRFKRWKYQPMQIQQTQQVHQHDICPDTDSLNHEQQLSQTPFELDTSFLHTVHMIDQYGHTFYTECDVSS